IGISQPLGNDPPHAGRSGGIEQVRCALSPEPVGHREVLIDAFGVDLPGNCGEQVDDRLGCGALNGGRHLSSVEGVDSDHLDALDCAGRPGEPGDLVSCGDKLGDQLASNDATGPRDEYSHYWSPLMIGWEVIGVTTSQQQL